MIPPILALLFLGLLTLILPWMAWASRKQLSLLESMPKGAFYSQAIFVQILLGIFSLIVARFNNLRLPLARSSGNPDEMLFAGALLIGSLILMMVGLRSSSDDQLTLLRLFAPTTFRHQVSWVSLSLVVAIVEEITYRAVLPEILGRAFHDMLVVMIIGSLLFGAAHLLQGVSSALIAAAMGFCFHLLVLSTGRLNSAIVVHFLYDTIVGFYLGRIFRLTDEEQH